MPRDLAHLQLAVWHEPLRRRKQGGGGTRGKRADRRQHGERLEEQAETVANVLREQTDRTPEGIRPSYVFKIQINPAYGELDDQTLARMGVRVLARGSDRVLVVAPTDVTLLELRQRFAAYSGRQPGRGSYGVLDAVEAVLPIDREDRRGRRLRDEPVPDNTIVPLDVELWPGENRFETQLRLDEVTQLVQRYNLRVTDIYRSASLCLLRVQADSSLSEALLDVDYVVEVERRPSPSFEMWPIYRSGIADFDIVEPEEPETLTGVVVVDSGVAIAHPLIAPVLGDAQSFVHQDAAEGGVHDVGGHGTPVAGIAIYGDVGECIASGTFIPSARLFSARVLNEHNEYDSDLLVETQITNAVTYFLANYPEARVVNLSLGDVKRVYRDGGYQLRLAAVVDELAYKHRDREVIFVVSSGNAGVDRDSDQLLQDYPTYLINSPERRLIDPATSAIALTVGGLSYGPGNDTHPATPDRVERSVAGDRGFPSPFTRVGWGVGGAIKPDLVDYAGDWRWSAGQIQDEVPRYAGLPSLSGEFAPGNSRLFKTVAGTSFAAPRVANLAARLFQAFPEASSNLVRALIVSSAQVPSSRPASFESIDPCEPQLLQVYGYGQPDFARARWSAENDVCLVAEGALPLDSFCLYEITTLPDDFFSAAGKGHLTVTLAFDPPTRPTRQSYLGVTMEAHLFRNLTPEQVADTIRLWDAEEREGLEGGRLPTRATAMRDRGMNTAVDLAPGVNQRKSGTLQRGGCSVSNATWGYDGKPLVLAVLSRRKWAPESITHQRFAVVVKVSHDATTVNLHAHIRQQARLYQRARLRVR